MFLNEPKIPEVSFFILVTFCIVMNYASDARLVFLSSDHPGCVRLSQGESVASCRPQTG